MDIPTESSRRDVLKTIGAGVVGTAAFTGVASADGKPLPRVAPDGRVIIATWGDDEVWEIFDAEPSTHFPEDPGFEDPRLLDEEGNDNAHEPLYLMKGLPTTENEHSPQIPLPPGAPFDGIDHVVPVPGGTDKRYSAQWHPKGVVDPDDPWLIPPDPPKSGFPNLVNQDSDGNYLTSSTKIEAAVAAGEVGIVTAPEGAVFTCPVRPHGSDT